MKTSRGYGNLMVVLVLLFGVLISCEAFAEDTVERMGNKAISFSFNSFKVDDLIFGIGGKYWLSQNTTLIGSFDLETSRDKSESSGGVPTTSELRGLGGGVSLGVERHFRPIKPVSPYLGAQIRYFKARDTANNESTGNVSNQTALITQYGADAIIGAEYWFTGHVTLAAQYTYGVTYEFTRDKTVSNGSTLISVKRSGYDVGTSASALILSLYF
ncbi:MAG TPA: outer membrane beta-barrel protein [Nitrospiria bacterium]